MKKTFVTVTLFVALALAANATNRQQDQAAVKQTAADQTVNVATSSDSEAADATEQEDIYRTYALQNEENDKHIIRFYDVDRIVVSNKEHALIRIYNNKWQLIEQTSNDVDKQVAAGNYYITSSSRIRGRYQAQ